MALEELQGYMHLPLTEAARRLSICPSVVKKICRRYGVTRWPYRRVCNTALRLHMLNLFRAALNYLVRG